MKHLFIKILLITLLGIGLSPIAASAADHPPVIVFDKITTTTTAATVDYKMTNPPGSTMKVYASLADINSGTWVRRDMYLQEIHANDPVPLAINVTYDFSELNLDPNKIYSYYLADGVSDPYYYFLGPKCFTTKGESPCTPSSGGSGSATTATTVSGGGGSATTSGTGGGAGGSGGSGAGGLITVPVNPTTGSGTAFASFSATTTTGVLVDGKCGPVDKQTTSIITATSANLCEKGSVASFTGSGPWTWMCAGANGGKTASCSADVGTDDELGDNFLKNPLAPGLDTFPEIFAAVVNNIVLPIAIPFLVIMLIYSGYLFVAARGKPEKLTEAKSALKYTLIGAALVLGAFVVANAIQATVTQLMG